MRRFLLVLAGMVVAGLPCIAQSEDDVTIPEFRQTLVDYAAMIDATRGGTNYATQVQNLSDATLTKWYGGVPNPRRFKEAVAGIKAHSMNGRLPARPKRVPTPASFAAARLGSPARSGFALSNSLSTAGISSVTVPDVSLFPPAYGSGSAWHNMVGAAQFAGLFPSGGDDTSNASVRCDPDQEAKWNVILATMHGIQDAAFAICEIIPDELVVVLGEGTEFPAKEICYAIALIINVFNSAAEGFVADCEELDGLVNSAQVEATYHNMLALQNQKFRLKAEANLVSSTPMGIFELPTGMGGFLEYVRAIVGDTISKMQAAGYAMGSANNILLQGDTAFNARNYKLAFKTYQQAYKLAVQ